MHKVYIIPKPKLLLIDPFFVETTGPWYTEEIRLFRTLGTMMSHSTNKPRSKSFFKQRIRKIVTPTVLTCVIA